MSLLSVASVAMKLAAQEHQERKAKESLHEKEYEVKALPDGGLHCCSIIEFDGKLNPSDGFVKRKCWLLGDQCTGNLTETLEVTENMTKSLGVCKFEVGILGKSIENHSVVPIPAPTAHIKSYKDYSYLTGKVSGK